MNTFAAVCKTTAIAAVLALSSSLYATTIDFDGTGAPCCFSYTSPLTNLYSGLGVTFGGGASIGGSILNQSGNFGFNALSGTDFLAFNTAITGNVENLTFSSGTSSVSIWAATGIGGVATMDAYNAKGVLVSSSTINTSRTWTELSVSGAGITNVRLTNSSNAGAYDNLTFNAAAVPEPETYALMLAGLGLVGLMSRRKRGGMLSAM